METFKSDEIVPKIIEEVPSAELSVKYPNGKEVLFGSELAPIDVKDEPTLQWQANTNKFYTIAMVDPDAPSREDPKFGEVKHWLVVNVPGSNVASGKVIAHYRGSGPPKGTGLHRYIFLVFEQPGTVDFDEPISGANSRENRLNFSIKKFAHKYGLKAVAGNYYKAQYDSYVDELNSKTV